MAKILRRFWASADIIENRLEAAQHVVGGVSQAILNQAVRADLASTEADLAVANNREYVTASHLQPAQRIELNGWLRHELVPPKMPSSVLPVRRPESQPR